MADTPPVLQNFTVSTVDDEGRHLLGDNYVNEIIYYDSTGESWKKNYSTLNNPFVNNDFSLATVTGTGQWYDTSSDVAAVRHFQFGKIPFDFENELFAEFANIESTTPTSAGDPDYTLGSYFVRSVTFNTPPRNLFPDNYDVSFMDSSSGSMWITTSGTTNHGQYIVDFENVKTVSGFYFEPGHHGGTDSMSGWIREYLIHTSTSSNPSDQSAYVLVASGTNGFNQVNPVWVETPATQARFVRLRFKNHGGSTTRLGKFYAYSPAVVASGIALIVKDLDHDDTNNASSHTLQFKQDVDLTGIDHLYLDLIDYSEATADYPTFRVGSTIVDQFRAFPVFISGQDFRKVKGFCLDVSSFTGTQTFQIRKRYNRNSSNLFHNGILLFGGVNVSPSWYRESASNKRGSSNVFPDTSFIISDDEGLSIIDASNKTLWMRFDYGQFKMLEERPRSLAVNNGKIYLSTSRGLYVVDFLLDRCVRYDERGRFHRSGIADRNIDAIDRREQEIVPFRTINGYYFHSSSYALPYNDIVSITASTDSAIGDFVFLGTSRGAIMFDEDVGFFSSSDKRPVRNVILNGTTLWYSQGYGNDTVVRKTELVSSLAANNFECEYSYYQGSGLSESFTSGVIPNNWEVINIDQNMSVYPGSSLTISGSHARAGATGLILKDLIPGRSFTAKADVKILDFPLDARGAVRFGLCFDYLGDGVRSVVSSSAGLGGRKGFFISALNVNAFRGSPAQDHPFDDGHFRDCPGWFVSAPVNNDNDTVGIGITPEVNNGVSFVAQDRVSSSGAHNLKKVGSTIPFEKRDFTARIKVKVQGGFSPEDSVTENNPSVFLGVSDRNDVIPGTAGTDQYINPAMVFYGNTSVSGVHFYTTARYNNIANIVATTAGGFPPGSEGDNTSSAIFKEWRIDFNHALQRITAYLEGEQIGTRSWSSGQVVAQPGYAGIVFGIDPRGPTAGASDRKASFKDFTITYPALISGSRYKYGMETIENDSINNLFTTYSGSGLSKSSNSSPETTALDPAATLTDGNLTSGGITMTTNTSVGIDLGSKSTIEGLLFYDSRPSSSGWSSNSNSKNVEVWISDNNSTWTLYRSYNFTFISRESGITRLNFSPALEARYIQIRTTSTSSTYQVDGTNNWAITEIRALKFYGRNFFSTDATSSGIFHEWKLDYDAECRVARAYIDGSLISIADIPYDIDYGQLVLMHDLTPVNSGTSSVFHGEFKNVQIAYKDTPLVPSGTIGHLSVNRTTSSNSLDNYTIFTGSTGGLGVLDIEQPSYINRFTSNSTNWSVFSFSGSSTSGVWAVAGGVLVQSSSSSGKTGVTSGNVPFGTHFIYNGDADPLTSRTKGLTIAVKPVSSGSMGVAWCRQDENNFYYLITSSQFKEVIVGKVIGGINTVLYSTITNSYYLYPSKRHVIDIIPITSSSFTIKIDGKLLIQISGESSLQTGKVALISNNNVNGQYSDVGTYPATRLDDQFRIFDHEINIVGGTENTLSVVYDPESARNNGLVFVGTNRYSERKFETRLKRPYWFDGIDHDGPNDFRYGNRLGIGYHPGTNKVYIVFDRLSPYVFEFDAENGRGAQISRFPWRVADGLGSTTQYQSGSTLLTYSPRGDLFWRYSTPARLGTFDVYTGEATAVDDPTGSTNEDSNISLTYATHKNAVVCAHDEIFLIDADEKEVIDAPTYFGVGNHIWGRVSTNVPWFFTGGSSGGQSAAYSDYDRSVYFIGTQGAEADTTADGSVAGNFYRFDIEKNELTDLGVPPFSVGGVNAQRVVYDPYRKRVYAISSRWIVGQFNYYDVVNSVWVKIDEDAPFTSRRGYPESVDEPTDGDGITCFAAYNLKNKSIYLLGRGRDDILYEYFPDTDLLDPWFDYKPSRDGFPSEAGLYRQFTVGKQTCFSSYTSESKFNTDYYLIASESSSNLVQFLDFSTPNVVTLSGFGESSTFTGYRQYYISSEAMESIRDFDVTANVAFPEFTTEIFNDLSGDPAEAYFIMGLNDGLGQMWVSSFYGSEDPNLYQTVELRAGVSGTFNNPSSHGPFKAHLVYIDGHREIGISQNDVLESFTSYGTSPVSFAGAFSDFRRFRLKYTYETDIVEGFVDDVSVGFTQLRRKFDKENGVRFSFGWRITSADDVANGHFWSAQIKDLSISANAYEEIRSNRLLTSISGTVGSYYHQRWDSTLVSGTSWVVETDNCLKRSQYYSGFHYICTIAGIGDGHKLGELVAYFDGVEKGIGITGNLDSRHDSSTYLATYNHEWDEIEFCIYKMHVDTDSGTLNVFVSDMEEPVITVLYDNLPSYDKQHAYYGKVRYGAWERIYETPTLSGTWTNEPNYTGTDIPIEKTAFSSNAKFATISQGTTAKAIFNLDENLGTVDLYTFYHSAGFDGVKNAPYTIYADSTASLPVPGGEGSVIVSLSPGINEVGASNPNTTTIKVDQRRKKDGKATSGDTSRSEASGWIYLGRYVNPTKVVQTASAQVGTSSTFGYVCADAVGVDIGKYGKSQADMSLSYFRYQVGKTEFSSVPEETSGLTVFDLETNERIDYYTEISPPSLIDGNITSGVYIP